jgi:hypothetical protein
MQVIKDLFSSKKFLVFLSAAIVLLASKLGFNWDPSTVDRFLGIASAYILGQGIADHGKEAAKVNAAAGIATSPGAVQNITKIGLIMLITLFAGIMFSGCGSSLGQTGSTFGHQVYDKCAKPELQGAILQAIPTIETAAVSGWKAGLDAAVKQGEADAESVGWCALNAAITDLTSHLGSTGAEGNESVGIANLKSYAAENGVTFK